MAKSADGKSKLRQGGDVYEAAFQNCPLAILIYNQDRKLVEWNREAETLFGPEEKRREEWGDAISAKFDKVSTLGRSFTEFETNLKRADGRTIEVKISSEPVYQDGSVLGMLVMIEDLTEIKSQKTYSIQSQKMELLGRLTGGVSHDLNNHLTIVTGYADLLAQTMALEGEEAEALQGIQEAARRATTLSNQLLKFSRRHLTQPRIFDINHLIMKLDQMLNRLLGENIKMEIYCGDETCFVREDLSQIEQVLVNLIVNARDAMPQGGRIELSTRKIYVTPFECREYEGIEPGDYAVITVRDTGIGMSGEVVSRIFTPFFTTKKRSGGTGLGLATCYEIVKKCKGTIKVTSKLGEGSVFEVLLKSIQVESKANVYPVEEDSQRIPRGTESVLLVEDDPEVLRLTSRILKSLGYRVHEAGSGRDLLEWIQKNKHEVTDLLFTDVVMPHMDGQELAKKIKARIPGIKVLYMSGYTDRILHQMGIPKCDKAFITKPFTYGSIAHKLREILD